MCQCCCCGCKAKKGFPDEFLSDQNHELSRIPFSQWLREEMKKKRISIAELAVRTEIPKSTLHGWMYGRVDESMARQARLEIILKDCP